ncbi:MAG: Macrolide export ATP-binding/permease protein MacB [Chloroflexi bacterium ADurb.Bin180]|nr:MAG: Macrolide export ATP-binding/permease protein MacB [Chloroflexi bacterium ADurb.Bin180]HQJ51018.1 ABC transporter permease [Anaerolineae bacterium]
MNVIESFQIALRALAANKLRSVLTMLGIIIGVGAVIALVAAGAGAQAQVAERFTSLGSNLLVVSPGMSFFRGVSQGSSSAQSLTIDDVDAISALASAVAAVAPEYSTQSTVVYRSKNTRTSIYGVTAEYLTVRNYHVERGRFIDALDNNTQARVVALGASVVTDLFGTTVDPLGKTVKINRQNYLVIGTMVSKGAAGGFENQDDMVFIPLSTAQRRFGGAGNSQITSISAQAVSGEQMDLAEAQLTAILKTRRGLTSSQTSSFSVQNQTQLVQMVQQTSQTFTMLLGSIAAISLIVGGIGIMNIMLVSVTERTREIGIRKAVGARRSDILTQFLVEAVVMSLAGGVMGVLAGYAGAQVVTPLLGATRAVVTSSSVIMALTVSIAVGLFFGIYPAGRAAALNPIDALRRE